jgi:hypothetical protein
LAGRDITEGRATRAIATDIGIVSDGAIWQNTDINYDVAIGGLPFIYAINDNRPYIRQTAPFRKEQFDNQTEPGEQSLTGWWIRSQSSFHGGTGITYFDPQTSDEFGHYRFADSQGVDVWEDGEVTLLKSVTSAKATSGQIVGTDHQHVNQHLRSIQWSGTDGVLLHDEFSIDKIAADGTVTPFIAYTGGAEKVYAVADDGVNAYWVTNTSSPNKLHMYKKALTDNTTTVPSPMFSATGLVIQYAVMEFVKDRIVLCVNNAVYELSTVASALPTASYTNTNVNYHYTSISASGPAIYTAGHSGIYSTIQKYTLGTNGVMPVLNEAVVAAELPAGEYVEKLYYYVGYMMIGTNKGVRAAQINDQDGSINYGPLIIETSQPVYDFAGRDRFIWAATGIGALDGGLTRIDLGTEIDTLIFAYANDLQFTQETEHYTTAVAFIGATNRVAFTTAFKTTAGGVYLESASTLVPTGYVTTGRIRYNTLEKKNFKRLLGRGDFTFGSTTLNIVGEDGVIFDVISYDASVGAPEVTTSFPSAPQEYVSYKFQLFRDGTDSSKGPQFKGYQAKATIATPRQRIVQFPVYCYDIETDRYNVLLGYQGRAFDKIRLLEDIEAIGDVVTWQDLTTGESRQAVIEQVTFSRLTPPDKRFDGFGGVLQITIRTV